MDKYLLVAPEEFMGIVMSHLISLGAQIIKLRKSEKLKNGIYFCEVIFTCPKINEFKTKLSELTNGKGSIELFGNGTE